MLSSREVSGYTCTYMQTAAGRGDVLTNKSTYEYGDTHIELYAGLAISAVGLITPITASVSIYASAR